MQADGVGEANFSCAPDQMSAISLCNTQWSYCKVHEVSVEHRFHACFFGGGESDTQQQIKNWRHPRGDARVWGTPPSHAVPVRARNEKTADTVPPQSIKTRMVFIRRIRLVVYWLFPLLSNPSSGATDSTRVRTQPNCDKSSNSPAALPFGRINDQCK